jgi:hypothetical protein
MGTRKASNDKVNGRAGEWANGRMGEKSKPVIAATACLYFCLLIFAFCLLIFLPFQYRKIFHADLP